VLIYAELTYDASVRGPIESKIRSEVKEVPRESDVEFRAYGYDRLINEVFRGLTDRGKQEKAVWTQLLESRDPNAMGRVAVLAVEFTIANDLTGKVGGSVDAVEVSRWSGIRWIQNCNCGNN
jgi:hypothetical protein